MDTTLILNYHTSNQTRDAKLSHPVAITCLQNVPVDLWTAVDDDNDGTDQHDIQTYYARVFLEQNELAVYSVLISAVLFEEWLPTTHYNTESCGLLAERERESRYNLAALHNLSAQLILFDVVSFFLFHFFANVRGFASSWLIRLTADDSFALESVLFHVFNPKKACFTVEYSVI